MTTEYGSKDSGQCEEVSAFIAGHPELARVFRANPCRLLELGCGTAPFGRRLLDEYPGLEVVGIDASAARIAALRGIVARDGIAARYRAVQGDILGKTLAPPAAFDAVLCPMVLHHFVRLHATRLPVNIRRWLKPGGLLILYEPNGSNPIGWFSSLVMRGLVRLVPRWRVYKDPDETVHPVGYYRRTFARAGFTPLHSEQGGERLLDWNSNALFLVNVRDRLQHVFNHIAWGVYRGTTQMQSFRIKKS